MHSHIYSPASTEIARFWSYVVLRILVNTPSGFQRENLQPMKGNVPVVVNDPHLFDTATFLHSYTSLPNRLELLSPTQYRHQVHKPWVLHNGRGCGCEDPSGEPELGLRYKEAHKKYLCFFSFRTAVKSKSTWRSSFKRVYLVIL